MGAPHVKIVESVNWELLGYFSLEGKINQMWIEEMKEFHNSERMVFKPRDWLGDYEGIWGQFIEDYVHDT